MIGFLVLYIILEALVVEGGEFINQETTLIIMCWAAGGSVVPATGGTCWASVWCCGCVCARHCLFCPSHCLLSVVCCRAGQALGDALQQIFSVVSVVMEFGEHICLSEFPVVLVTGCCQKTSWLAAPGSGHWRDVLRNCLVLSLRVVCIAASRHCTG